MLRLCNTTEFWNTLLYAIPIHNRTSKHHSTVASTLNCLYSECSRLPMKTLAKTHEFKGWPRRRTSRKTCFQIHKMTTKKTFLQDLARLSYKLILLIKFFHIVNYIGVLVINKLRFEAIHLLLRIFIMIWRYKYINQLKLDKTRFSFLGSQVVEFQEHRQVS